MVRKTEVTERRSFLRLPVEIRVDLKPMSELLDTKGLRSARVKNLSQGGILFHSARHYPVGATLQLKLDFTRGRSHYDLAAIGQVVRCSKGRKGQHNIGVKFLEIYPDDLALLKGFIEKKGGRKPS
jgi:Tfp pilus assembly protein PilZ